MSHRSGFGRGLIAALLASALLLGLAAGTASADIRHPNQTLEFGSNGTEASKFNSEELKSVVYDNKHNRVYVLTWPSGSEVGRVYGFDNPSQGVYTTRPGFPVATAGMPNFNATLAVDDSDGPKSGRIYFVQQSQGSERIHAIEPNGQLETISWPVPMQGVCDADVDPDGNVWASVGFVGGVGYENKLVLLSGVDGAQLAEFALPFIPCRITFDRNTDDVYVSQAGGEQGYYRLRADSDYQTLEGPFSTSTFLGAGANQVVDFDFDGATSRLYAVKRYYKQEVFTYFNFIHALTPDGTLIEEFGKKAQGGYEEDFKAVAVNEDNGDVLFADNIGQKVIRVHSAVVVPDVVTGEQTANDEISGSVNRAGAGAITDCYFEYATDEYFDANGESYDQQVPCEPSNTFDEDRTVTATVPGVENETIYHYRLVAENANGQGTGVDRVLEPHDVDYLKTRPATAITRETATLNGSFNGNGEDTTYYFQWGTDDVEDNESTPVTLTAPTGDTDVSLPISNLSAGTTYRFRIIAEVGANESVAQELTFTTNPAIKDIETLPATEVAPNQAMLNGSLDPDGYETHYYFEYGKTKSYGQTVPVPPGDDVGTTASGATNVSTLVTNLEPGVTYHFRLVASNSTGTSRGGDQAFVTPQAPSINAFSSRNVTATTAELTGQIEPNGFATSAYFEYGTTLGYGQIAEVPQDQLEGTSGPHNVVVSISGLEGVTYHFRLIAVNTWGETVSEDQTFDFFAPTGCPNHGVRQQTGAAYLPDCRAYELVSPRRAGGATLSPRAPTSPYATSPGRFAFEGGGNAIPNSGEPSNAGFTSGDIYIASRTLSGWNTRYAGVPGSKSLGYTGPLDEIFFHRLLPIPTDTGMNKILIWDRKQTGDTTGGALEGTNAPFIYDNEGNEVAQVPTNVADVPGGLTDLSQGGWRGASKPSGDFRHYFFSTNDLNFSTDPSSPGITTEPGSVYDNDIEAETVTVVSKTEEGDDIPRDVVGDQNEYIRIPYVSRDGSHVLMTTEGPSETTHLYMAVNRGDHYDHYEVSEGQDGLNHAVDYEGVAAEGSIVYFTSTEQLTADDADSVRDLYRWTEAGNEVTRVSVGAGGTGNTDNCGLVNCGVLVVPYGRDFGYTLQSFNRDTVIASDTGDIYFYSPEQLDGSRGILGKRNLYVLRSSGTVEFVATFETSSAPSRMNVSPEGRYMAMLTEARLTSFDNAGLAQVYTYDADTREIRCVSCPVSGDPATSDAEVSQNGLFMTADGRAFFATKQSLVPRDANGVRDVYEFVAGRPQLISSGAGDVEGEEFFATTGLVGVSLDGTDVFFATRETLVPQDENGNYLKFYDARTNGGFAVAREAAPCAAADECHGPETTPPAQPVIGTGAPLGETGNAPPQRRKARKGRCNRKSNKRKSRKGNAKRNTLKRKAAKRCVKKKRRSSRARRGGRRG